MKLLVFTQVLTLMLAAVPAMAHYAFGGEFDANRPVLLRDKVVKMEWPNPHAWIHIEITKPDGTKEVWMFSDFRKLFPGSSGPTARPDNAAPTGGR